MRIAAVFDSNFVFGLIVGVGAVLLWHHYQASKAG